ncbi:hypothetical protein EON66_06000 [archaeon]|nr:MAG: hypothetical protein EON66_06000 [archaeon]
MDAMLLLEGDALRHVYADFKRVFEKYDRGLTLHEFVHSFLCNVSFEAFSPKQLVKLLVDLFRYVTRAWVYEPCIVNANESVDIVCNSCRASLQAN